MKLFEFLKLAGRSLLANKLRSSLTMLGMIIGVSAVIILMSVGAGLQNMVTSIFQGLGTNLLFVQPANPEAPGFASLSPSYATASITMDDAEAIGRIHTVTGIAPTNENFVKITFGNKDTTAVIHGSTPDYIKLYRFTMASGQFISQVNQARRDMVLVVGNKVAKDLFGNDNPIGKQVKIKEKRFTIIGVMAPRGISSFGFSWDELVVTPIATFQARLFSEVTPNGQDAVQSVVVQVTSTQATGQTTDEIKALLRRRHHIDVGKNDDFAVVSPEQLLGTFSTITLALTVFLGMIGGISLLVGSIGIMNIMLVSVTERTREIGLRKAIGAKRRDILMQFLLEAATLSLVGGAIGLAIAWSVAFGISQIDLSGFRINAVVSPLIVTVAVSESVIIGLISGIYPAIRASRLNPIDALRYG